MERKISLDKGISKMQKNVAGVIVNTKFSPELDPDFIPLPVFMESFLRSATVPFAVAIEREDNQVQVYKTFIHDTPEKEAADRLFAERLVKFMLWSRSGFRLIICGSRKIYEYIKEVYSAGGKRSFDFHFMQDVYDRPFEVLYREYADCPKPFQKSVSIGRNLDGCRIGFDAGGSDRKVSAVIDGVPVFSDETVWNPKVNADPMYNYEGIVDSFKKAAAHMPRVDAIGVSSAGIFINNETKVASLFLKVPPEDFKKKVRTIYIDAAREIGENIPLVVANDGDVTALAGSMSLQKNGVLGIAMGTSEAGGYVDLEGKITGWMNEFAFSPIDLSEYAMVDEWSGDKGCGVKYFSQDGVIKLCPTAGIDLKEEETPAEKLKTVQMLMEENDPRAVKIFNSIGVYLGYALKLYSMFYEGNEVLLLGRVVSGKGGERMLDMANKVLRTEFPNLNLNVSLPSEKTRRVGQAVAAASLPKIEKKEK